MRRRARFACAALNVAGLAVTLVPVAGGDTVSPVVRAWIVACQRRDAVGWQSLFTPEGTYEDPLTRGPVLGAHHAGPWANLWPQARKWEFVAKKIIRLTDATGVEWHASLGVGQWNLVFSGFALLGEQGGRIAWMRNYFDTRPFLNLLSAPPVGETVP